MTAVIELEADIDRLVMHLHDDARVRPVCIVSTRHGSSSPLIDVDELEAEVGAIADVHVIPTGALTWRLSELMSAGTHVFGGAGRVYPLGTAWRDRPHLSPLRFVWQDDDAPRALAQLIADARRFATTPAQIEPHAPARPAPFAPLTALDGDALEQLAEARRIAEQNSRPTPKPSPVPLAPTAADEPPKRSPGATPSATGRAVSAGSAPEPAEKPTPSRSRALRDALIALEAARAENRRLVAAQEESDARARRAVESEMRDLIAELGRADQAVAAARADAAAKVNAARARYSRGDADAATTVEYRSERFDSVEAAVRHAILLAWVERVPAAEKAERPLPEYLVGPDFADTLAKFDGGQQSKALRAVVDVLTDRAKDMPARALHVLRQNNAGDSGARTRDDGAIGYRAYIEQNVASARRLHFWKRLDGTIELARVVLHDDASI